MTTKRESSRPGKLAASRAPSPPVIGTAPQRGYRTPKLPATRDGLGHGHVVEIQRARIVSAMIDVVAERSRANTTVAHVVTRSGVSRRTFYEIFDDFEDCFLAALNQSLALASEYIGDAYDHREKWLDRIRAALIGVLEFLDDEPAMGRLCLVETLGAGHRAQERRARIVEQMIAAVDEGRQVGKSARVLPPLTAEGVVGGILSVLHARLIKRNRSGSLLELTGPLTAMIVLPYLGPAAAQKESVRPLPERRIRTRGVSKDPLRDLDMRLTYRTVRVLLSIAASPGASNREVGVAAGIEDQGQISKLLSRLEKLGLIGNNGAGQARGAPNSWTLTEQGFAVREMINQPGSTGPVRHSDGKSANHG